MEYTRFREKVVEVISEFESRKLDTVVLSEIKQQGNGIEAYGPSIHFYSGVPRDQRAKRGVSVFIKNKLKIYVTDWEPIDENPIKININLHGYKCTIIGVGLYAISEDEILSTKDIFFSKLSDIKEESRSTREVIIAADFNGRTGKQMDSQFIGPFGEDITNDNGNRLVDIIVNNIP